MVVSGSRLFRYRWYIGLIVWGICVLLELHGSSIGIYSELLHTPDGVLLGHSRFFRGDEWAVNTPLAFSQYYNDFSYFSDIVRGTATDMFIIYGQAVKDPAVLLRPFEWGYLFLSPARGLAFFWMGRWIILFLVSLEFGLLISRRNKIAALIYGMLVALSPYVQWWFAVCSIAEILICGQAGLLLFYHYLREPLLKRRLLYGLGITWLLGVYIFSIYPAWQVSCGYVFLVLLCWIWRESRSVRMTTKYDFCILFLGASLLLVAAIPIIQKSWPAIQLVKETVYPGSRFMMSGDLSFFGPGFFQNIFGYAIDLWLPFVDIAEGYKNNCEAARVFDFAPAGAVLALYFFCKREYCDFLLSALLLLQMVFLLWWACSWPAWLVGISLISNVPGFRLFLAFGLVNLILLVRVLSVVEFSFTRRMAVGGAAAGAFAAVSMAYGYYPSMFTALSLMGMFAVLWGGWYLILCQNLKGLAVFVAVTMLFAGGGVNPVVKGTDSIYASPAVQEIQKIARQDKGLWLAIAGGTYNNIPIMAGAPTINSINTYPVLERWYLLDPQGEHKDIYNRYAHIQAEVTMDATQFIPGGPDSFTVHLNVDDLPVLGVKYIFSLKELDGIKGRDVSLARIFYGESVYIYQVNAVR